jgi:hypothetical protein
MQEDNFDLSTIYLKPQDFYISDAEYINNTQPESDSHTCNPVDLLKYANESSNPNLLA